MKITNLEELIKLMEYYFSDKSPKINSSEEKLMKEHKKNAIEKIDEAPTKIKEMALFQLREWVEDNEQLEYRGQIELVKFICECLHDEDRIQLIKKYFESQKSNDHEINSFRGKMTINYDIKIDREHLLILLHYLPDDLKITALIYARPIDLIRIMGEINEIASNWRENPKTRKYYKKYYNIFTKVLEEQNKN